MYDEFFLDRAAHLLYEGPIDGADVDIEVENESCGDKLRIFLKFNGEVVEKVGFTGAGCAVSKVSADIMLGLFIGKTRREIAELAKTVAAAGRGEAVDFAALGEAALLERFFRNPARTRCAGLAWKAFLKR